MPAGSTGPLYRPHRRRRARGRLGRRAARGGGPPGRLSVRARPRLALRARAADRPARSVFEISDALGLAAFTVTGVVIAIRFGATPLWLRGPLLAMPTAAGGGILRDVVRSDPAIPTRKTSFHAEIALVWGLLLCLAAGTFGSDIEPAEFQTAVVATIAGAFLARLVVVGLRLRGPRF